MTKKTNSNIINQILELKKQFKTIKEIALTLNISVSTVKHHCKVNGVQFTPEQRQKNSFAGKLAKNPNAMQDMRKALTPEVIAKRSDSIRKAYGNETLCDLKGQQSKKWWAELTPEVKTEYLNKRAESMANSPAMQEHLERCRQNTGDKNFYSQYILRQNNVKTFDELMHKYAEKRQGKYLSDGHYVDNATKVDWECSKGHKFSMKPGNVKQGTWCPSCPTLISKPQQEIYDFIQGLYTPTHTIIHQNARQVLRQNKELDIYLPNQQFAIEYNGLYWHCGAQTSYYAHKHYDKYLDCQKAGIKLLAIYGDEWEDPTKQCLIKNMIRYRLGFKPFKTLRASKLQLHKLEDNSKFDWFFKENHLDGHSRASYAYGLYHNNILVMCLSIRRNFNKELEICRMATMQQVMVHGGAGRLIKAALKDLKEPLYTFSNNRLGSGDVYAKNGAVLVQENSPSYWYTDGFERVWRYRCKRNNDPEILKLFPTEKLQAEAGVFSLKIWGDLRPLYQIHDYGHKKWCFLLYKER